MVFNVFYNSAITQIFQKYHIFRNPLVHPLFKILKFVLTNFKTYLTLFKYI